MNNFPYTDQELELLKNHFADNEQLLKLLRRIFLPRISDSSADVGSLASNNFTDVVLHPDLNVKNYPSLEQALIGMQAHSKALQHIENGLVAIKLLAGKKTESVADMKKRLEKDSTK